MREEVKKMDKYSERIRFLCKYKIEAISDLEKVKEQNEDNLRNVLNERNRLYYRRKCLSDDTEKEYVTKDIINVTDKIKKIRKEIKFCDEILTRSLEMREQVKNLEEKNRQKQKEVNSKKKDRKYER